MLLHYNLLHGHNTIPISSLLSYFNSSEKNIIPNVTIASYCHLYSLESEPCNASCPFDCEGIGGYRQFDIVCRSCSKDAIGFQTTMEARIAQEDFSTTGLMVMERNWLLVYRYSSWDGAQLPPLQPGDTFAPAELLLRSGQTQPPPKLSERDLLSLMDRFGIGTDATVAEHIARQQVSICYFTEFLVGYRSCMQCLMLGFRFHDPRPLL